MNGPVRNLVFIALTLAGVAALNAAIFAFVFDWGRPVQIAAGAAAILCWAAWLALGFRLRDPAMDHDGQPAFARSGPFGALTLIAVLALVGACWAFAWRAPWPVTAAAAAATLALWTGWFLAYRLRLRADTAGGPEAGFSPPDAARNRYMMIHIPFVLIYVLALSVGASLAAASDSALLDVAAVAVPAVVLAVWALEFTRMIRRADEMVKAAHFRALAIAGGVLLLAQSFWAIAEAALGAPSVPGFLLLPAYAVIYATLLPFQGAES